MVIMTPQLLLCGSDEEGNRSADHLGFPHAECLRVNPGEKCDAGNIILTSCFRYTQQSMADSNILQTRYRIRYHASI